MDTTKPIDREKLQKWLSQQLAPASEYFSNGIMKAINSGKFDVDEPSPAYIKGLEAIEADMKYQDAKRQEAVGGDYVCKVCGLVTSMPNTHTRNDLADTYIRGLKYLEREYADVVAPHKATTPNKAAIGDTKGTGESALHNLHYSKGSAKVIRNLKPYSYKTFDEINSEQLLDRVGDLEAYIKDMRSFQQKTRKQIGGLHRRINDAVDEIDDQLDVIHPTLKKLSKLHDGAINTFNTIDESCDDKGNSLGAKGGHEHQVLSDAELGKTDLPDLNKAYRETENVEGFIKSVDKPDNSITEAMAEMNRRFPLGENGQSWISAADIPEYNRLCKIINPDQTIAVDPHPEGDNS
jgi:hypothetical protein